MPTIEENKYYVVLVELEVEPNQQQAFIDEISEQVERHIKHFPVSYRQFFMPAKMENEFITTPNGVREKITNPFWQLTWKNREKFLNFIPNHLKVIIRFGLLA